MFPTFGESQPKRMEQGQKETNEKEGKREKLMESTAQALVTPEGPLLSVLPAVWCWSWNTTLFALI